MPRIGQQLGNYRLVRFIANGGFADVYLGKHIHLDTVVAVKILKEHLLKDYRAEFLQEAKTIAQLQHAHIIRLIDFGINNEDNAPYLIMEYASGGTLRSRHPRGSIIPLPSVVSYVNQIAEAVQFAHNHKLIHRDLKPDNFLVKNDGNILLSDFGIVAVAHNTWSLDTSNFMGTVAYSAPEQLEGRPRRESDQYALGLIAYEWLSGDRPFSGDLMKLVTAPVPLTVKNPGISKKVELVIMKSLERDPKERYTSIQAFADALEQATAPPKRKAEVTIPVTPTTRVNPDVVRSTTNQSTQLDTWYQQGITFYHKGKLKEAIEIWKLIINVDRGYRNGTLAIFIDEVRSLSKWEDKVNVSFVVIATISLLLMYALPAYTHTLFAFIIGCGCVIIAILVIFIGSFIVHIMKIKLLVKYLRSH